MVERAATLPREKMAKHRESDAEADSRCVAKQEASAVITDCSERPGGMIQDLPYEMMDYLCEFLQFPDYVSLRSAFTGEPIWKIVSEVPHSSVNKIVVQWFKNTPKKFCFVMYPDIFPYEYIPFKDVDYQDIYDRYCGVFECTSSDVDLKLFIGNKNKFHNYIHFNEGSALDISGIKKTHIRYVCMCVDDIIYHSNSEFGESDNFPTLHDWWCNCLIYIDYIWFGDVPKFEKKNISLPVNKSSYIDEHPNPYEFLLDKSFSKDYVMSDYTPITLRRLVMPSSYRRVKPS